MEDTAKDLQANYTPKNYIDYKISQGDTFTQIFLKQGDTTKASLKAYEALRKVNKSYTSLRLGEIIKIYKKDGKIDKIEKKLPLGKEVTLTLNDDGSFTAKVYEPKIIEKDRVVIDDDIMKNSEENIETRIKLGDIIGKKSGKNENV